MARKKADPQAAPKEEETKPKHIVEAKSYVELSIPYRDAGFAGVSYWTQVTRYYTKEEALELSALFAAEAAKLA